MRAYTPETTAEIVRVNTEMRGMFLGKGLSANEIFEKKAEYALAHVSPAARDELLWKEELDHK
jgi:hypothetical protein